jgi:hypothetical protein
MKSPEKVPRNSIPAACRKLGKGIHPASINLGTVETGDKLSGCHSLTYTLILSP